MLTFQQTLSIFFIINLKKVKTAMAQWSREIFGNIFQEVKTMEEVIKVMEVQFEADPSGRNREKLQEAQANLNKYLHRGVLETKSRNEVV